MPMRHGLTMGELGALVRARAEARRRLQVVRCTGWQPERAPGYGWPLGERSWVNPSPNAPNLSMARCYAGTVMLEGTTLSEGPRHDAAARAVRRAGPRRRAVLARCSALAPQWLAAAGCASAGSSRPSTSTSGKLCAGCRSTSRTRATTTSVPPVAPAGARVQGDAPPAYPDYPLWRDFPYEYERDRLAIDLINGSPLLREWVDDPNAAAGARARGRDPAARAIAARVQRMRDLAAAAVDQVEHREHGMPEQHPRTRVAHHLARELARLPLVAVDRAVRAGRLLFAVRAVVEARIGVGEERRAAAARAAVAFARAA
jgi:hypothetical protein